jgi:DNA-binding transcriptional MerR regulator
LYNEVRKPQTGGLGVKIKEICERTGLTDRTVRYYIDAELVNPFYTENYLGRKSFDFSEHDLELLQHIATLRTFGFTVDEIKGLVFGNNDKQKIVEAVKLRTKNELDTNARRFDALSGIDGSDTDDLKHLVRKLSDTNIALENENTPQSNKKRFLDFVRSCGIFLAVWLPIIIPIIVLIIRFSTAHTPSLRPVFFICTLLCFLPTVITLLSMRKIKGKMKKARIVLVALCILCIPLVSIFSAKSVSSCNHSFEPYRTIIEPTCSSAGEEARRCNLCGRFESVRIDPLPHKYTKRVASSSYLRTPASATEPATYYYSCACGNQSTAYFSYGSVNVDMSDTANWTPCEKTVYAIKKVYFYSEPESSYYYSTGEVGCAVEVVSTNGIWYKVKPSGSGSIKRTSYIKCIWVTDDAQLGTFVEIPDDFYLVVSMAQPYTGFTMRNDISDSNSSQVGRISIYTNAEGNITVAAINKAKTWVAFYYSGLDSEGRSYDTSRLYYCHMSDLSIRGLPEYWP